MLYLFTLRSGLLAGLVAASATLAAQQPVYNLALTEPDQELDDFSGGFTGLHRFSAKLRGVRGMDNTVYWVSADSKHLTAYKRGRQVWQTDVSRAFTKLLPSAKVDRLALSSNVIFVMTTGRGHAEIDRTTGSISALGVDPN
jgi:hypothetical protein